MPEQDFGHDFLAAINALEFLEQAMVPIGLAGSREFERLRASITSHGAETFLDIENRKQSGNT